MNTDAAKTTITLADFLFKYGPWGMCAALLIILVLLYLHMSRKNIKQFNNFTSLLEKRNNQMLTLVQRCINAMTVSTETVKNCKEELTESGKQRAKMNRAIVRCEYAASPPKDENL